LRQRMLGYRSTPASQSGARERGGSR
jgi:hypothetical protein